MCLYVVVCDLLGTRQGLRGSLLKVVLLELCSMLVPEVVCNVSTGTKQAKDS